MDRTIKGEAGIRTKQILNKHRLTRKRKTKKWLTINQQIWSESQTRSLLSSLCIEQITTTETCVRSVTQPRSKWLSSLVFIHSVTSAFISGRSSTIHVRCAAKSVSRTRLQRSRRESHEMRSLLNSLTRCDEFSMMSRSGWLRTLKKDKDSWSSEGKGTKRSLKALKIWIAHGADINLQWSLLFNYMSSFK